VVLPGLTHQFKIPHQEGVYGTQEKYFFAK
jgi:hypothetical protein